MVDIVRLHNDQIFLGYRSEHYSLNYSPVFLHLGLPLFNTYTGKKLWFKNQFEMLARLWLHSSDWLKVTCIRAPIWNLRSQELRPLSRIVRVLAFSNR